MTVQLRWTCRLCGVVDAPQDVTARGAESVTDWMEQTAVREIGVAHRRRSPGCPATTVDLKIPITGTDRIGGPILQ